MPFGYILEKTLIWNTLILLLLKHNLTKILILNEIILEYEA